MRRIRWLLALALLIPETSFALQFRWSTGSTDLTVTQNTRATLILQADSTEGTLPASWRLQWATDSLGLQFVALDSVLACQADTAKVSSIDPPATPADSAANLYTAHLCSYGESSATTAYYQVDLIGGSAGKLRAVALDPVDSTSVIESNEVTYNGGTGGDYAPAILSASRTHVSSTLRVDAVGVGLGAASLVQIAAPDTSWSLPLNVTARTATTLSATAQVAADLPPFVLRVGGRDPGVIAVASLEADTTSVLSVQPACVNYMKEINPITHEDIQPKDFAIVASRDSFHIFYIRHDMNLATGATEKSIGHQRSHDLYHWYPDENTLPAIQVRPTHWDNYHVWAPTIIKKPNDITYYMLYTGVTDTLIGSTHQYPQRIGVATSFDLNVWSQDTTWVYSPDRASNWAATDLTSYSGQQFRDPFVMPAPDTLGDYLMFFVAGSMDRKPRMVVGLARSHGDLRQWRDAGPFWSTDSVQSRAAIVESPHAFFNRGNQWSLYYTGSNPVDQAALAVESKHVVHARAFNRLMGGRPHRLPCGRSWL